MKGDSEKGIRKLAIYRSEALSFHSAPERKRHTVLLPPPWLFGLLGLLTIVLASSVVWAAGHTPVVSIAPGIILRGKSSDTATLLYRSNLLPILTVNTSLCAAWDSGSAEIRLAQRPVEVALGQVVPVDGPPLSGSGPTATALVTFNCTGCFGQAETRVQVVRKRLSLLDLTRGVRPSNLDPCGSEVAR